MPGRPTGYVEHVEGLGDLLGGGGLSGADVPVHHDDPRILVQAIRRVVEHGPKPVDGAILVIPRGDPEPGLSRTRQSDTKG